jgi:hypothetical protein
VGFEPTEGVNPHALSRSALDTSPLIVQGVSSGQPAGAVPGDRRRSWANATRIAPGRTPINVERTVVLLGGASSGRDRIGVSLGGEVAVLDPQLAQHGPY